MEKELIITCESTVDLPYTEMSERAIPVIFYTYTIDNVEYTDNMGRDANLLSDFYDKIAQGKLPTTSQINPSRYYDFFEAQLQKGDLIHVSLSSGITPSIRNAQMAAEELREKYPDRKIEVIDSLCISCGYGLLVQRAAELRDRGVSFEEVKDWIFSIRKKIQHHFFSSDLKHFRRSGRISGATATIGTILGICPVMRVSAEGKLIAYSKARGKDKAIQAMVDVMHAHATDSTDYSDFCWICHSNCPEDAEKTKAAIMAHFPHIQGEVRIFDVGTIIASHTGPGTIAVFFLGDDRIPE